MGECLLTVCVCHHSHVLLAPALPAGPAPRHAKSLVLLYCPLRLNNATQSIKIQSIGLLPEGAWPARAASGSHARHLQRHNEHAVLLLALKVEFALRKWESSKERG